MSGAHEAELLAAAAAGDAVAVQQLLLLHHERVVATIHARMPGALRSSLSADDICQEAYVAAIRGLPTFRRERDGAFLAWLLTIAERKLADAIRARGAAKRGGGRVATAAEVDAGTSLVALLELMAVNEQTPSRSAVEREVCAHVQAALARLADDQRDVLRLRYVEGLSVAETAERLKRSEGAVRMLCSRALQRLGKVIGDPSGLLSQLG